MQKANVMTMIKPVVPLRSRVQAIPRGSTREASRISSAEKVLADATCCDGPLRTHVYSTIRTQQCVHWSSDTNQTC